MGGQAGLASHAGLADRPDSFLLRGPARCPSPGSCYGARGPSNKNKNWPAGQAGMDGQAGLTSQTTFYIIFYVFYIIHCSHSARSPERFDFVVRSATHAPDTSAHSQITPTTCCSVPTYCSESEIRMHDESPIFQSLYFI